MRQTWGNYLSTAEERDPAFAEWREQMRPGRELAIMLAASRLQLGLTQRQFADNAGVTQAYISQLESGNANPSIRRVAELLRRNGMVFEMRATPAAKGDQLAAEAGERAPRRPSRRVAEEPAPYNTSPAR